MTEQPTPARPGLQAWFRSLFLPNPAKSNARAGARKLPRIADVLASVGRDSSQRP